MTKTFDQTSQNDNVDHKLVNRLCLEGLPGYIYYCRCAQLMMTRPDRTTMTSRQSQQNDNDIFPDQPDRQWHLTTRIRMRITSDSTWLTSQLISLLNKKCLQKVCHKTQIRNSDGSYHEVWWQSGQYVRRFRHLSRQWCCGLRRRLPVPCDSRPCQPPLIIHNL